MPNHQKNIYIHQNFNKNEIKSVLLENANYDTRPVGVTGGDKGLLYFDTDINRILVWNGTEWKIVKYFDDRDFYNTESVFLEDIWALSSEFKTLSEDEAKGLTGSQDIVQYFEKEPTKQIPGSWSFFVEKGGSRNNELTDVVFPRDYGTASVPDFYEPKVETQSGYCIPSDKYLIREYKVGNSKPKHRIEFLDGKYLKQIGIFGVGSVVNPPTITFYKYIGPKVSLNTASSITSNGSFILEDASFNLIRTDINLEDSDINSSTDLNLNVTGEFNILATGGGTWIFDDYTQIDFNDYTTISTYDDLDIAAYGGGYVGIGAYDSGSEVNIYAEEQLNITGGKTSSVYLDDNAYFYLGNNSSVEIGEGSTFEAPSTTFSLLNSTINVTGSGKITIAGTATDPNDVVTKKELVDASNLKVTDFNTGASFSNINNIIFRGQSLVVPNPPGATADGVFVQDGGQRSVVVWIPKPTYKPYFNTQTAVVDDYDTTLRYVADPGSPAAYNVGDWTDFDSITRDVLVIEPSFSGSIDYTSTEFGVLNTNTTLEVEVLDGDGSQVATHSVTVATSSSTSQGITIDITSFQPDEDRYQATANFTVDFNSITPLSSGGRLSVVITHNNDTDGTYTYSQNNVFYDSDIVFSNANIGGVNVEENTPSLKWASGIAYYELSSTFDFEVIGISNINDRSFPTGGGTNWDNISNSNQLRLNPLNFAINNPSYAHSTDITGWTSSYDISGLTWSFTDAIDDNNTYVPGLDGNQDLNTGVSTLARSNFYDWSVSSNYDSAAFDSLIDTYTYNSTNTTDVIGDEGRRLDMSNLTWNSGSWDSQADLANDALQVAFDKVIYPRDNYSAYYPQINITNSRDYSTSATGPSKSFDIYTQVNVDDTTTNVNFDDFRWYASNFLLGSLANTGTFTFTSNIVENDFAIEVGNNTLTGDGDVVILVGHDSQNAGSGTTPDKFICLTDDYSGRTAISNNFDGAPKKITYTWGTVGNYSRIWILVGVKSAKSNRFISQISLAPGT